ncbi:MAG: hypothetical protein KAI57_02645 [Candidatus Pacebacteria bacterium]|nr:hypothetical protein [Candidatus Paceibacterota bacterium]
MDNEYDFYKSTFKEAQEHHIREANKLDKMIILISFGSIALSVNFVFKSDILFRDINLIILSWIFFILTIIFNFISLIFCERRFWFILENLEDWRKDNFQLKEFNTNTFHSKYIKIFNFGSYILLILAIFFLTVFGIKNLKYDNIIENKNITKQEAINKTTNNENNNKSIKSYSDHAKDSESSSE